MIDIEDTEKRVKQVDSLLTTITNLIKKHWLILIVICIGLLAYWVVTLPDEPVYEQQQSTQEVVNESDSTENSVNEQQEIDSASVEN